MKDFDVVVVGELNADLILRGDVMPAFGQVEKLIDDATLAIGSSSAICACGLARLGLGVAFVGVVGDDEFGRFMVRELTRRGVDTGGIRVDPALQTGLTVILSRGVDRAMLTYAGSIAALSYAEIDLAALDHARHLHLGSYFLLDNLRPHAPRLFDAAHLRGLTVSLDTNYDPAGRWDGGLAEALQQVDVFLPNEAELRGIARVADTDAALEHLAARVPVVAVKLGARGALARCGGEIAQADSLPVSVVDTVGAGDSFDAAFVYGYLARWELRRTLRFASVCGSLSTRAAGGTAAQPTFEEAMAYLA
jgi:sugar/nucleoside kinase (ribokinase family)